MPNRMHATASGGISSVAHGAATHVSPKLAADRIRRTRGEAVNRRFPGGRRCRTGTARGSRGAGTRSSRDRSTGGRRSGSRSRPLRGARDGHGAPEPTAAVRRQREDRVEPSGAATDRHPRRRDGPAVDSPDPPERDRFSGEPRRDLPGERLERAALDVARLAGPLEPVGLHDREELASVAASVTGTISSPSGGGSSSGRSARSAAIAGALPSRYRPNSTNRDPRSTGVSNGETHQTKPVSVPA